MKSKNKEIIKKITSLPLLSLMYRLYKQYKNREYKTSYGQDHSNITFYVYGQDDDLGGLWWTVNKVVMHIAYAQDKGYVPVIDMQNYISQYQNKGDLHSVNTWERFFKQPCGYDLDDISSSKNVIIASKTPAPQPKYLMGNKDFYEDPQRLAYFRSVFKNNIFFSDDVQHYLDKLCNKILGDKKVLGVLCRGTDYLKLKPKGHPIQPEPIEVIDKCKLIMSEYGCTHIFIATEDIDILNMFKEEFSNNLLYIEQERASQNQIKDSQYLASVYHDSKCDKFDMGLNYLSATYLLSRCTCFIGGRTGGTKGVLLLRNNEEFDYLYIYNLGLYN